ncbi:polysaccharide deacetylase family protein [Streptomyces sp. NRRL S-350]|uniref:polysaccharide deacetylase family protein n=1 Tax=Streptomyces sp. NRRL S-350 TaxID=1463902 RepID=UPI0004C1EA88|nr:polysaccharide deacetylase family protein [Streptomyces sp. NRRL S-350]
MDLNARVKNLAGSRVALAVAAVVLTVGAWGVATLADSDHTPGPNAAQEHGGSADGTGGDGRKGNDGSGSGGDGGTQQPGGIPDGIAHASESGGNAVNITIDDGPDPTWTPKVLDILKRHGVTATFCMIGPQAKAHPDLVKQVVAAGHRLCDHTVHHDTAMDKKPVAYQEKEILDAKKMIEDAAGGANVQYYRAPGGSFTSDSRRIAAANGMRPLGWNIDSKDFNKPGTAAIVDTVKKEIHNGPTILFHDGGGDRQQTVEALDQVLTWLKAQGRPTGFAVQTTP